MSDLVKRLRSVPPCSACGEYPGGDIAQIMDIAADRIEALERQIAALESAIEPFAEAADEADEWPLDDENQAPVDVRQCRAARTALAAYEATKEQSDETA